MFQNLEESQKKMSAVWRSYVNGEPFDSGFVRELILRSWDRSKNWSIDPYGGKSEIILTEQKLNERLQERFEIMKVVKPFMEHIYSLVRGSGFIIVWTDEEVNILSTLGDNYVLEKAKLTNFIPGASWHEWAVGTNALCLARIDEKPIQVIGAEHYCITHHPSTCSAAPVRNPEGNIIGILNMTGSYEKAHSHTLGIVSAATKAIENHLINERSNGYIKTTLESVSCGIITINENGKIINANSRVGHLLNQKSQNLIGREITEFFKDGQSIISSIHEKKEFIDKEYAIRVGNRHVYCFCTLKAINNLHHKPIGAVISFDEAKRTHHLGSRIVGIQAPYTFNDIITQSKKMLEVLEFASIAARSSSNVLIQGESGTGKELFAQAIHNASSFSDGSFVAVNCAAIPRDLIESELFGYEGGSFTGSRREGRPGKFEIANGGTILLDEIGLMPLDMQVKLLRVIQDRNVFRVGGHTPIPIHLRIIAATNIDLAAQVNENNFHESLFYRINVLDISIPPLRERKEDIPLLCESFIKKLNIRLGKQIIGISAQALKILMKYDWPGNIRELENILERAANLAQGDFILPDNLPSFLKLEENPVEEEPRGEDVVTPIQSIKTMERSAIVNALHTSSGNIAQAARILGIGRVTLYRKLKKYKIEHYTGNARSKA